MPREKDKVRVRGRSHGCPWRYVDRDGDMGEEDRAAYFDRATAQEIAADYGRHWQGMIFETDQPLKEDDMAKLKQGHLPEMEPPSIAEIDNVADLYVDARDKRMKLNKKETDLQGQLEDLMKTHKLKRYEYDGKVVMLTANVSTKIKVCKADKAPEEDDDEEEDDDVDE